MEKTQKEISAASVLKTPRPAERRHLLASARRCIQKIDTNRVMMTPIPTFGLTQSLRKKSLSLTRKSLSSEIHHHKMITVTKMECRVLIAFADNLLHSKKSPQLRKARHTMTSRRAKEGVGLTAKNR